MKKTHSKPPPTTQGNVKGRLLADHTLAKQNVCVKHDYKGLWEKVDLSLKIEAQKLAKELYEKRKTNIEERRKPKPKAPVTIHKFLSDNA